VRPGEPGEPGVAGVAGVSSGGLAAGCGAPGFQGSPFGALFNVLFNVPFLSPFRGCDAFFMASTLSPDHAGMRRPSASEITASTRNATNRIFAIDAALAAIPPKPKIAAMIAMMKKVTVQPSMMSSKGGQGSIRCFVETTSTWFLMAAVRRCSLLFLGCCSPRAGRRQRLSAGAFSAARGG
jgi:hypothetical protein